MCITNPSTPSTTSTGIPLPPDSKAATRGGDKTNQQRSKNTQQHGAAIGKEVAGLEAL